MNPKNLMPTMQDGADPFLKEILSSAGLDQPPPDAKGATLAALGLLSVAPALAAAAAAGTREVAQVAQASGAAATSAIGSTTAAVAKVTAFSTSTIAAWVAGGIAVAVLATGISQVATSRSADAPAPPLPTVAMPSISNPQGGGIEAVLATATTVTPAPVSFKGPGGGSQSSARPVGAKTAIDGTPAAPAATSTLARETALLSEAREALSAGDTATARARLQTYDVEFSDGLLRPEASVLRARLSPR